MFVKMTDTIYTIEVCCTGNNGRSPMAEAIGNKYLEDKCWQKTAKLISSGTRADQKWDYIIPYKKAVSVLDRASKNSLMKSIEIDKDRYEFDEDYKTAMIDKVHMAMRIMRPIEAALRDAALYDIGLKYNGKRTQTKACSDISLVLGMEKKHVDHVNEIYSKEQNKPEITTITDYLGIDGEIPDSIGSTNPKTYFEIRDILSDLMPKVILKFKDEHDYEL